MAPQALIQHLYCPNCGGSPLFSAPEGIICRQCGRKYPEKRGVFDFILYDQLGETEKKELKAMTLAIDNEQELKRITQGERGDAFQRHFLMRGIRLAAKYLSQYAHPEITLCTVGSGAGFELKALPQYIIFDRIIASDISWTAACAIGRCLEERTGELGLLACDFNQCPIKRSPNLVCFVFEAIHHSDDACMTLKRLMKQNFDYLVIVEPTRNWLVNIMSRWGLTMNIEYSGLKPDWIYLPQVRDMAASQGYGMEATTWWSFPSSRVPEKIKNNPALAKFLCIIIDTISHVTRPFRFGSMSAVHLKKEPHKEVKAPQ